MADFVRAIESDTGNVVELDLTPQWSKENRGDSAEQQAITAGNAKFIPDQRPKGKPCGEIPPGFAPPRGWNGCSHGFMAPHLVWPKVDPPPMPLPKLPNPFCGREDCKTEGEHKHGKGRPKGSKNKPRNSSASAESMTSAAIAQSQGIDRTTGATPVTGATSLADTPGPAVEVIDPAKLAAVIKALKDAGLV